MNPFQDIDLLPPYVLLVEDNDDDVFLTQHAFERAGIDCFWQIAATGEEAISYLSGEGAFADRETYPLPMVVLLDLKLPPGQCSYSGSSSIRS